MLLPLYFISHSLPKLYTLVSDACGSASTEVALMALPTDFSAFENAAAILRIIGVPCWRSFEKNNTQPASQPEESVNDIFMKLDGPSSYI